MKIKRFLPAPPSKREDDKSFRHGSGRSIGNFYDSPDWDNGDSEAYGSIPLSMTKKISREEQTRWAQFFIYEKDYGYEPICLEIKGADEGKLPRNWWKHPALPIYVWYIDLGSDRQAYKEEVLKFIRENVYFKVEEIDTWWKVLYIFPPDRITPDRLLVENKKVVYFS